MVGLSPTLFLAGHIWHQEAVTEEEDPAAARAGENGVVGIVSGETYWGMTVKGHYVHYSRIGQERICSTL